MMKRFPIGWMAACALGLSLAGCSSLQDPVKLQWVESEQPDYGNPNQWLSLPSRQDASDATPKRLPERFADMGKDSLEVDVFFVHPTMYFRGHHWNAQLDNAPVNRATERSPMRLQASAFNIGGRLYAPRYRQAHIGVFTWQDTTSWKALELAYEDVRRAFIHYLENWNSGRGIILAGHSQGSWHVRWLLQEFFDGSALQDQLVVAYGPGFDWYTTDFQQLSFCEHPEDTGCVCSWMSYGAGFFPAWLGESGITPMCTHPVTWRLEGGNSISNHQGVVLSQMRYAFPKSIEARIERGVLQIEQPQVPFGKLLQRDNWHIGDINLFWIDVRKNAHLRAKTFRRKPNFK